MQIFIFDNTTNSLRIDDYSILLVKEFAKLWEPERNKCKEDKKGEQRIRAYKEFAYIYLVLDFKSPYFKYLERDKHEAALADSGLDESDLKDGHYMNKTQKHWLRTLGAFSSEDVEASAKNPESSFPEDPFGFRVEVRFGNRKLTGFVTEVYDKLPESCTVSEDKIRHALRYMDKEPLLTHELYELALFLVLFVN